MPALIHTMPALIHTMPAPDSHDDSPDAIPLPKDIPAGEPLRVVVEARAHGWRLDHYLCRLFPNFSRAAWQRTVDADGVRVNNLHAKSGRRLRVNDILYVTLPEEPDSTITPENIPLDVLYEDESIVAINKPWGLIVHPGRGNPTGTLAAALQFHFDKLSDAAGRFRPGIVHRLDKNTSGVLVIAKNNQTHDRLTKQFEARTVEKQYRAIVWGQPNFDSDWIETYLRVHPNLRETDASLRSGGRCPPGRNVLRGCGTLHRAGAGRVCVSEACAQDGSHAPVAGASATSGATALLATGRMAGGQCCCGRTWTGTGPNRRETAL